MVKGTTGILSRENTIRINWWMSQHDTCGKYLCIIWLNFGRKGISQKDAKINSVFIMEDFISQTNMFTEKEKN